MNPTHNLPAEVDPTPADVLRGAARYLELHGWTQDQLFADAWESGQFPPACALGAIAIAAYGCVIDWPYNTHRPEHRLFVRSVDFAEDYIDVITCRDASPLLSEWNDIHDRTAEEVITALRAAADDWDRTHTGPGGAR